MKRVFRKLKSQIGESLIESLCAIMIFTMASVVLFSMVTAAADINNTAKVKDAENQEHLVAVEKGTRYNGTAQVNFTLILGQGSGQLIGSSDVDIYGGQGGSLYTYFVQQDDTE